MGRVRSLMVGRPGSDVCTPDGV